MITDLTKLVATLATTIITTSVPEPLNVGQWAVEDAVKLARQIINESTKQVYRG